MGQGNRQKNPPVFQETYYDQKGKGLDSFLIYCFENAAYYEYFSQGFHIVNVETYDAEIYVHFI